MHHHALRNMDAMPAAAAAAASRQAATKTAFTSSSLAPTGRENFLRPAGHEMCTKSLSKSYLTSKIAGKPRDIMRPFSPSRRSD